MRNLVFFLFIMASLVLSTGCSNVVDQFLGDPPSTENPKSPKEDDTNAKGRGEIKVSSGTSWSKVSGVVSATVDTQYHQYKLIAPGKAAMKVSISSGVN